MILPLEHRNFEITDKLVLAHDLFKKAGKKLKTDPSIGRLLLDTVAKVRLSGDLMYKLGINELCRKCDEEEGGSCCAAGIENRYDAILLLLNLLADVELPVSRFNKKSCYFLGPSGCVLKIRHTLCVNFLCPKIEEKLSIEHLVKLQAVLGDEMDSTFLLYEAVKKLLQNRR